MNVQKTLQHILIKNLYKSDPERAALKVTSRFREKESNMRLLRG
jgi:hypothetical protein